MYYIIVYIISTWYSSLSKLVHQTNVHAVGLPSIAKPLKVEPKLKNIVVELTSKASLVRVFPLSIHDLKSYIFVRWTSVETQICKITVVCAWCL